MELKRERGEKPLHLASGLGSRDGHLGHCILRVLEPGTWGVLVRSTKAEHLKERTEEEKMLETKRQPEAGGSKRVVGQERVGGRSRVPTYLPCSLPAVAFLPSSSFP